MPSAITIDVEGAELLVLRGAQKTLKENNVKVWVSIHPDLSQKDYKKSKNDLLEFMEKIGYQSELLGIDHEEHHYFSKHE